MENNQKVSKTSKSAVWAQVQELIKNHKISDVVANELAMILEPKQGGGNSLNPPKLDEDGNIVEAYCRYHQRYEIAKDMVISNNKSKGYCKAAISKWNKARVLVKSMSEDMTTFMSEGKFEEAQAIAIKSKELSENCIKGDYYDYDEDWKTFNKTK